MARNIVTNAAASYLNKLRSASSSTISPSFTTKLPHKRSSLTSPKSQIPAKTQVPLADSLPQRGFMMTARRSTSVPTKTLDVKSAMKRSGSGKAGAITNSAKKNEKAVKDPNMPKKPPGAFILFMEDFKEQNPNSKGVTAACSAGGEKWKTISEAEKAVYMEGAEKKMADYKKVALSYNQEKVDGGNAAPDGKI